MPHTFSTQCPSRAVPRRRRTARAARSPPRRLVRATARAAAACVAAGSAELVRGRCAAAPYAAAAPASCRAPVARVGVDRDEPVADAPHVLDPVPAADAAQLGAQPA